MYVPLPFAWFIITLYNQGYTLIMTEQALVCVLPPSLPPWDWDCYKCIDSSCLLSGDVDHGIWLLDLSLDWHYLCASFSDYLRLAIAHLGLVQWPYALTPLGLSPLHEVSSPVLLACPSH